MVTRTNYAIPIDVIRRVDSSITQADIGTDFSIDVESETITAHIESVEAEFERRAIALRDQSESEELHEGIDRPYGYTIYLDNENIKPFDTNAGDKVEMRVGRDTWEDVTDSSFLDTDAGVVEVDNRLINRNIYYPRNTNYRFRITYRYGASGDEAGATTTTAQILDSDTTPITLTVDDASQFEAGTIALVGGEEYVFISDVNENTDEFTISERALRGTTAVEHASGDDIQFMPLNVRDAISAEVASRLIRQDDFFDALNEGTGDTIDGQQKVEDLQAEFEATVNRYTGSAGYV